MNELSELDYVVFIVTLIIPLVVGFYYNFTGGGQSTVHEHMLADGRMTILPVAFSLMASFMSAITMLGLPSEMMLHSTQFALINVGYVIGTPIAAYLILPVFYEKRYLSVFTYLEARFNRKLRLLASNLFTFEMILYMGIVLYAPTLALSAVTKMPKWTTIIVIGIVCTVYCVCGGIKAVLYNDVFQCTLMFAGLLLILFRGLSLVGGWSRMWEINWDNDRIRFLNFSPSFYERHTFWSQLIGGTFLHLSVFSINQTQLQRMLTLPTLKKSQLSLWVSLPITMALSLITCLTGLVMYAYYKDCDPILSGKVAKPDQMIPYMMMELFSNYRPIPGLIVAAIFAGAISSVASFVNSLAVVTLEEIIRPLLLNRHSSVREPVNGEAPNPDKVTGNKPDGQAVAEQKEERCAVIYSKLLGVVYGLLCLIIAYLCEKIDRLLETCLVLFGLAGGPMLALFTLGISSRRCTANGAIFGFAIALVIGSLVGFGPMIANLQPTPLPRSTAGCPNVNPLVASSNALLPTSTSSPLTSSESHTSNSVFLYIFRISYMWISPLTWLLTTLMALLYSRLFPDPDLIVDESLLMPILRRKQPTKLAV